jgi:hypothetical protein
MVHDNSSSYATMKYDVCDHLIRNVGHNMASQLLLLHLIPIFIEVSVAPSSQTLEKYVIFFNKLW